MTTRASGLCCLAIPLYYALPTYMTLVGRGAQRQSLMSQFVSLVIKRSKRGEVRWLRCKRDTAEKFGWLEAYDEQVLGQMRSQDPLVSPGRYMVKQRIDIGGHGIRIGTGVNKSGYAGGRTYRLRCHSKITNGDLAELANFTKGEWTWLESMGRERRTPEEWAAIFAVAR